MSFTHSIPTIPISLISSLPAMVGGAVATRRSPALDDRLVVADQREAPVEKAKREVGLPRAGRAGDQHRPAAARDRARVKRFGREARRAFEPGSFAVCRRKPDGEAGARWRVIAVVHVNLPIVTFDNGLGDGKAKPGMPAETFALSALLNGSG